MTKDTSLKTKEKEFLVKRLLQGKKYYCDKLLNGYSIKLVTELTPSETILISLLADKQVPAMKTYAFPWERNRYHFYGIKLPLCHHPY